MAFPVRPVFTPFVVVVGGKYFLPVPECLLFDQDLPAPDLSGSGW
jgi:hypothetical protein